MNEPSADSARPILDYATPPNRIAPKTLRALWLVAIVLAAGAIGAGIGYLVRPVTYIAVGYMKVSTPGGATPGGLVNFDVNKMEKNKRAHASALVKLARNLHVNARIVPIPQQKLIEVDVLASSASAAARSIDRLMDSYAKGAVPGTIQIASRAPIPMQAQRQPMVPVSGFFAGLLVAILALLTIRKNSKAVTDPQVASPL